MRGAIIDFVQGRRKTCDPIFFFKFVFLEQNLNRFGRILLCQVR